MMLIGPVMREIIVKMHFIVNAASRTSQDDQSMKETRVKIKERIWKNYSQESVTNVIKEDMLEIALKGNLKDGTKNPTSKGNQCYRTVRYVKEENLEMHNDEALPVHTESAFGKSDWIIDPGATQNLTFKKHCLVNYVEFNLPCVVYLGDNRFFLAYGKSVYHITADLDGSTQSISICRTYYTYQSWRRTCYQ